MHNDIPPFERIFSLPALIHAWRSFSAGKKTRDDVSGFSLHLMANLRGLHHELADGSYQHGGYAYFKVRDPKPRDIHKASIRDRLLHHALHRKLYPFFDRTFIADSFSCRFGKGTHRAINRFRAFAYKASRNHTRTCFVLKYDIRKFFANIDHQILFSILARYIPDKDTMALLENIVESFSSGKSGVGLPLGNLTSQLMVNIYMNEFDQFVKHKLKVKYYIRYADDFVMLSHDRQKLEQLLHRIEEFLLKRLKLALHPDKVFIKTVASGVDFLGWAHFPDHRVLRTSTKRRMFRRLQGAQSEEVVASYLGLLSNGNAVTLQKLIEKSYSTTDARTES